MPDPTGPSTGALGNIIGKGGLGGANVGGGLANQVRRIADRASGVKRGTGEGSTPVEGLLAPTEYVGSASTDTAAVDITVQVPDRETALAVHVRAVIEADYAEAALARREWTMSITGGGGGGPQVIRPQTVGIDPTETIRDSFEGEGFWFPGGPDEVTATFYVPGAISWTGTCQFLGIV